MNVCLSRVIASLPWNHAMRWSTLPVHLAQVSYKLVRNLERGEVPPLSSRTERTVAQLRVRRH